MITSFGKKLRKLRNDNNILMREMAQLLDVSVPLVSAVETGKKNVPMQWIEKLALAYGLSDAEKDELINAAKNSVRTIRVDISAAGGAQRGAALSFARNFGSLSDDAAQQIANILEQRR